ncbi:MAG: 16S rRNA (guanine(966)-N(2))-methyltransferase RsmD, partial [Chloroflexota bacterium]|nr:16S rRNA (guanine(966)-N(2))-methyltransferase RsmD [Chloroflexota bacterium]
IRLAGPGTGTRPLSDRVKQTLFAILEPDLAEARVLDLFAGSGAAGIEALSRGAAAATLVESDAAAVRAIADNLSRAHVTDRGRVVRSDVLRWLAGDGVAAGPFDIVFVDPPYAEPEVLVRVLETLGGSHGLLAPGTRVIAKHFWRDSPPSTVGLLASDRERRFGETALTFYRRQEG